MTKQTVITDEGLKKLEKELEEPNYCWKTRTSVM